MRKISVREAYEIAIKQLADIERKWDEYARSEAREYPALTQADLDELSEHRTITRWRQESQANWEFEAVMNEDL